MQQSQQSPWQYPSPPKNKIHICLLIMAKNEEHCIGRAIRSAIEHVDSVFLVDTGSSDATVEVARKATGVKPFGITEHNWEDFGTNRTRALQEAQMWTDQSQCVEPLPSKVFFLLLDADDEVTSFPDRELLFDGPDCFEAMVTSGPLSYPQIKLLRSSTDFIWVGKTHEQLQCVGKDARTAKLPGFSYKIGEDSARRLAGEKTKGDIELLHKEIEEDQNNTRAWFYLGISYRVDGQYDEAFVAFKKRVELQGTVGGFVEEAYLSLVWMGDCRSRQGEHDGAILCWLEAINYRHFRPEAYTLLAEHFLRLNRLRLAEHFASDGLDFDKSDRDRLFVDVSCKARCTAVFEAVNKALADAQNKKLERMLQDAPSPEQKA